MYVFNDILNENIERDLVYQTKRKLFFATNRFEIFQAIF